jgi:predicted metal-dependent hydrolase
VVTIPKRFARREVPAFVERNREWIESALARVEQQTPERYRQWPPRQLSLPAIDRVLELSYSSLPAGAEVRGAEACASEPASPQPVAAGYPASSARVRVDLCVDPGSRLAVARQVSVLLRRLARDCLPQRLSVLADRHGLSYHRVQVRGQRTLWGSCSSNGTISLNYKLLFLSPALVDYVLLHELAHTKHLDHSPAFWRKLLSMEADARSLDQQLTQSGREVPPWLELVK